MSSSQHIHLTDDNCYTFLFCQGRISREKYWGKPCMIVTVAPVVASIDVISLAKSLSAYSLAAASVDKAG